MTNTFGNRCNVAAIIGLVAASLLGLCCWGCSNSKNNVSAEQYKANFGHPGMPMPPGLMKYNATHGGAAGAPPAAALQPPAANK